LAVFQENDNGTTTVPLQLGMEESVFIVFKKPAEEPHLTGVKMKLEQSRAEPISNLEIIKAEYGTFLQEGLMDITDKVNAAISNGKLDFKMTRAFCDCDPAMGYKKEFRMEYQIGDSKHQLYAEEREHIHIDAGHENFKILKAIFGKFKSETKGVPKHYQTFDVTDKIKSFVASGTYDILISDEWITHKKTEGHKTSLKITYKTDGELRTMHIPKGQTLKLSKDTPKPEINFKEKTINWLTPYSGEITYQNTLGETKTTEVVSIPKPIDLSNSWEVTFESYLGASQKDKFSTLMSWSHHKDENIRYFSGTATYRKAFEVSDDLLQNDKRLELDLGSVAVIAEVFVNGKKVSTLWKAPFRTYIDAYLIPGKNTLEVSVTNLWTNRLIGDESLTLDYKRKGDKIKELPEWLLEHTERPSNRTTFSSWKHWRKEDKLLTSGLLGPVKLRVFKTIKINE